MTKIYVGNLPYNTTDEELRAAFEPHGEVASAEVVRDRETGRSRGFGFVKMAEEEDARRAVAALNESSFGGRNIVVDEARSQRGGAGGGEGGGRGGGALRW